MRPSKSSNEINAHSASTCVYLEKEFFNRKMDLLLFSHTQLNDDVYEIVQLDMIEQYRTHHLMLDKLFQDKVEKIELNMRLLRNS